MGKLTISMAIFNSFLYVYQRVDDFPIKAYQHALFCSGISSPILVGLPQHHIHIHGNIPLLLNI